MPKNPKRDLIPSVASVTSKLMSLDDIWGGTPPHRSQPSEVKGYKLRLYWRWNGPFGRMELKETLYEVMQDGSMVRNARIGRTRSTITDISSFEDVMHLFGHEQKSPVYGANKIKDYSSNLSGYIMLKTWGFTPDNARFVKMMERGMNFLLNEVYVPCEKCGTRECSGHFECYLCRADQPSFSARSVKAYVNLQTYSSVMVCGECYSDETRTQSHRWKRCQHCGVYTSAERGGPRYHDEVRECGVCFDKMINLDCCGRRVLKVSEFATIIPESGVCYRCTEDSGLPEAEIHYWDYRPELIFHPDVPVDPKRPLYIGMELEMSFPDKINYETGLNWWRGSLPQDLFYAKSDSSVNHGFELVTHPFNPEWALDGGFPFEAFERLKDNYYVRETHRSSGTHIHVNKEAFTSSHLWKFLRMHHDMQEFIKMIAGRGDGTYSSFSDSSMRVQKQKLLEIAKQKGKPIDQFNRYVAVNLRNEYTIELRYMRSGPWPNEIKKNIEWALIAYDYTGSRTMEDVRNGALRDADQLRDFIASHPRADQIKAWIRKNDTRRIR